MFPRHKCEGLLPDGLHGLLPNIRFKEPATMPTEARYHDEELQPLTREDPPDQPRPSSDSLSSVSTTSLVLEHLHGSVPNGNGHAKGLPDLNSSHLNGDGPKPDVDLEDAPFVAGIRPTKKRRWSLLWIFCVALVVGWAIGLVVVLIWQNVKGDTAPATWSRYKKKITIDQVLSGQWRPRTEHISWIDGANGEDGLLLEREGGFNQDYLVVKDVRGRSGQQGDGIHDDKILMKKDWFVVDGRKIFPSDVWPSRDLTKVLVISDKLSVSMIEPDIFKRCILSYG